MYTAPLRFVLAASLAALAGCGGGMDTGDAGRQDAPSGDAASNDTGSHSQTDSGTDRDASATDAVTSDDVITSADVNGTDDASSLDVVSSIDAHADTGSTTDARTDTGSATDARTDTGSTGDAGANVSSILVPRSGAWFGAMSNPRSGENQGSAIARFETVSQRTLDIAHAYHSGTQNFPNATEQAWAAGGRMLLVNWKPSTTSWGAAADGSLDATVIGPAADRIRAFGHPIFLVLWHEPEDQLDAHFDTAANYVAMWRHVHDVFAAHHVTNVVWVWNMMGYVSHAASWTSLYPGDAYVDWLGADPYTFASQTFDQSTQSFYDWANAHVPNKPIMYCEFGPYNANGSYTAAHEASWIHSMLTSLQTTRTRVKAVVYWENSDPSWTVQTAIDSSTTYRDAVRSVVHDPFFNQPH